MELDPLRVLFGSSTSEQPLDLKISDLKVERVSPTSEQKITVTISKNVGAGARECQMQVETPETFQKRSSAEFELAEDVQKDQRTFVTPFVNYGVVAVISVACGRAMSNELAFIFAKGGRAYELDPEKLPEDLL
ncbi:MULTISPECIES: hypothetical protein [unclassified Sinorhizobium]|uniref:hypothetical protein n=1 Tax=unclassified Sinorhizobium TaxID=2613772 RepID=UPI003525DAB9